MTSDANEQVTHGTTNVFADLGLPDAEGHLLKAQLVSRLADVIAALEVSQTEAAARMGLTQPDLSNMLRGRFRGYSIERLMRCLVALGSEVDIVIRSRPGEEPETIHLHR